MNKCIHLLRIIKIERSLKLKEHPLHLGGHLLVGLEVGELEAEKDAFDLLEATFPAGTLTGAPKVRAMELLAELEKSPRGLYGGVAGFFSYTGDMNFAIVIRTMFLEKGLLAMRAGAGAPARTAGASTASPRYHFARR